MGTGLVSKLTRRNGATGGILVGTGRTGCTGCTLVPLVTGAAIRMSGVGRLSRGGLLGLLLLTMPAVGITLLALPPIPVTIPA